MHTLLIVSILTLFINSGVDGGASGIGVSATPLFDGFKAIFGEGTAALAAGSDRPDRTDRQLLHDHLRVRSQHLLALSGPDTSRRSYQRRVERGRRPTSR
jgi:hypothetical protein